MKYWQYVISIGGILIIALTAIINLYSRVVTLEQKEVDVQNQLCAQDTVRNVIRAEDLRFFKMLFENAFPGHIYEVGNAFYPTVGQCGGGNVNK